tara:strand:+ start:2877 stop:3227 length:351 start_codon:yes stop_codon:yes gene_type:complete
VLVVKQNVGNTQQFVLSIERFDCSNRYYGCRPTEGAGVFNQKQNSTEIYSGSKANIPNDSLETMALENGNDELVARMCDSSTALNRPRNLDFVMKVREIFQTVDEQTEELMTNYMG